MHVNSTYINLCQNQDLRNCRSTSLFHYHGGRISQKDMYVWIVVLVTISVFFSASEGNEDWKYTQQLGPRISLHWNFDQDSIKMKIIGETKGWVGIGFAPARTMAGADLIIGGVLNGKEYVYDCYAAKNGPPTVDADQNVDILDGVENATHTTITVKRPLKSDNAFDNTIKAGEIIVIWAIGRIDVKRKTTVVKYRHADRGFTEVELLRGKEHSRQASGSVKTQPEASLDYEYVGFPYHALLDKLQPVNLYWDFDESTVTMQVIAPTKGWVGLGFSRSTSMNGADIIMMGVRYGEAYALDCHSDRNGVPVVDQNQNVEVIGGWENDTHTGVTIRRSRSSCNSDDMDIDVESGTYKVIWAYGVTDLRNKKPHFGYYHSWNRGGMSLKLINPISAKRSTGQKDGLHVNVGPSNFLVPAKSTFYLCQYAKLSEANETLYITGISPQLTEGNERNVHHVIIYLCEVDVTPKLLAGSYQCYDEINPYFVGCGKILGGWAVGGSGTSFPEDSGFPVGGHSHPQYVMVEMHYDNPEIKEFHDSSGMQISYITQKPETMVGLLDVQHSLATLWIPPGQEHFQVDGYCRENCLTTAMEGAKLDEVKVFGIFLHSHLAGTAMRLRHFRNGTELKAMVADEHYDFNYQEIQYFEEPKLLKAGDALTLECGYTTLDRKNITPGGLPTSSEMCIAFLLHYPPLPLTLCGSRGKVYENFDVLAKGLSVSFDPEEVRSVGEEISRDYWNTMKVISEKLLSGVVWDDQKRRFAQEFMQNTKQYTTCLNKGKSLLNYFSDFMPPNDGDYVENNPSCPLAEG